MIDKVYTIRPLTVVDSAAISTFVMPDDLSTWSEEKLAECLNHPDYCAWGLEYEASLLAYIIINIAGPDAEMMYLAVDPKQRNQGLAKKLLQFSIATLKQINKERVMLEVRTDNIAAIKLYEGMSFEKIGVRKKYYYINDQYHDAWVYELIL